MPLFMDGRFSRGDQVAHSTLCMYERIRGQYPAKYWNDEKAYNDNRVAFVVNEVDQMNYKDVYWISGVDSDDFKEEKRECLKVMFKASTYHDFSTLCTMMDKCNNGEISVDDWEDYLLQRKMTIYQRWG